MATNVEKVRLLIGDSASPQNFSDANLQVFLDISKDMNGGDVESVFLACALACDSLGVKGVASASSKTIGDYSVSFGSGKALSYKQMAEMFRTLELETPAFALAEVNNCDFSELEILKNYILRNVPV